MGECIDKRIPWFTYPAIEALEGLAKPGMRVLEWGAGGSTLWWLDRGCDLVTIEHDARWAQVVSESVADDSRARWELRVIAPEKSGAREYESAMRKGTFFRAYSRFPWESGVTGLDVVSVDGRARPACMRIAAKVLRSGGTLILDNSDRTAYSEAIRAIPSWGRKDFWGDGPEGSGMKWMTTFLTKP